MNLEYFLAFSKVLDVGQIIGVPGVVTAMSALPVYRRFSHSCGRSHSVYVQDCHKMEVRVQL